MKSIKYMVAMLLCACMWAGYAVGAFCAEQVELHIGFYEASAGFGQTGKKMIELIEEFAKANPQYKVTYSSAGYSAFFNQLPVHLVSGVGPDVWLCDGVLVAQYKDNGFALDLTTRVNGLPNIGDYFGIDTNRDNEGHIWAFPQGLQVSAFFYNKEHFQKGGLAFPTENWTLDDVRMVARKLTLDPDNDGTPNQYGFRSINHVTEGWYPIIRAFGGDILDKSGRKSMISDSRTIDALRYMVEMVYVDRSSPPPGTNVFDWFPQQLVSMQYGLYIRTFPANERGFDYDITLVPIGPGGRFNPVIVNSWVINAQTSPAKQQAAWDWIMFFSSEYAQREWTLLGEAVPINRKVAVTTFMQMDVPPKNRMVFVNSLEHAVPISPSPIWSKWQSAVSSALNNAFYGRVNVYEAAMLAHQNVQVLLDEYYANK